MKNLKLKDPFNIEWIEYEKLVRRHGENKIKEILKKLINKRYINSIVKHTPKCCGIKMRHIGDRLDREGSDDCFRQEWSEYTYYHEYRCIKCKNQKERIYHSWTYEGDGL